MRSVLHAAMVKVWLGIAAALLLLGYAACGEDACESGACCDNGSFVSAQTQCAATPEASEVRCTSDACGADVEQRQQYRYCSGMSAACDTSNLVWHDWAVVQTCDDDALCQSDDPVATAALALGVRPKSKSAAARVSALSAGEKDAAPAVLAAATSAWCTPCPNGCAERACLDAPPTDPADIAPAYAATGVTTFAQATAFLYSGDNPLQTGVQEGAIAAQRVCVIRGRVLDRAGAPVPDVSIAVHGHPELGQGHSRDDGAFDIAVNGGAAVTLVYAKAGYPTVHRRVETRWQDYAAAPDVVLVALDAQITEIDLTAPAAMQVARGSVVTDSAGQRQATVLFAAGTQAQLMFADGSAQSIDTLSLRATEYTVGESGQAAMPAALPPTSGYTYAVEYSVDQALELGAASVQFNQPVIHYNEDFIGFPIGTAVPSGYYDRQRGQWLAQENGRVVRVVAVTDGMAELDTTGDGVADNGIALGVTDAERSQLGQLYAADQALWRVPLSHFSPEDFNWPFGPPQNASPPNPPAPEGGGPTGDPSDSAGGGDGAPPDPGDPGDPGNPDDGNSGPNPPETDGDGSGGDGTGSDGCEGEGSIIECEKQILRQRIPLVGTPYTLNYASDRTPGFTNNYSLKIPLIGDALPDGVKRVALKIEIAGREFHKTFAPEVGLTHSFTWDGKDGYGRVVQGRMTAHVGIGYVYDAVYYPVYADYEQSFARAQGAQAGPGPAVTSNREGFEVTVWKRWRKTLGTWNGKTQSLGGWSLDVQHAYDPASGVLYRGDGTRRSTRTKAEIATVCGNGHQAELFNPQDAAVGPDGSLYIADTFHNRVLKLKDDVLTQVAGIDGPGGFSGDGGPATAAQLSSPWALAVSTDGALYIADNGNARVRRVDAAGIITTVAGGGGQPAGSDGPLATELALGSVQDVAITAAGELYIADAGAHVAIKVDAAGRAYRVAGGGSQPPVHDMTVEMPARDAYVAGINSLALAQDGTFYFTATSNGAIHRVTPDGMLKIVNERNIHYGVQAVALTPDDTLLFVDIYDAGVKQVKADGTSWRIIGSGTHGNSGDGGFAQAAQFQYPVAVAFGPDGAAYVVDSGAHVVRRVAAQAFEFAAIPQTIPSADGSELYSFDAAGRHVATHNAVTGVLTYQLDYDAQGQLVRITDADGDATTVARDGNGITITARFGQTTELTLQGDGYLQRIVNPAAEAIDIATSAAGLMQSLTDAKAQTYSYSFDSLGRLMQDSDPEGGFSAFTRSANGRVSRINQFSALGRKTAYRLDKLGDGQTLRTITFPDGTQNSETVAPNGHTTTVLANGTQIASDYGPDPRFGTQVPLPVQVQVSTPSGLTSVTTTERSVVLAEDDPSQLVQMSEMVTVNGKTATRSYDVATRQLILTSPEGRTIMQQLDDKGRVIAVHRSGLASVFTTYDAHGRPQVVVQGSAPSARQTELAYHDSGWLKSLTDPLQRITTYDSYDLAGRLLQVTPPGQSPITYGYDANGNLTALTPPQKSAHHFDHNRVDLVSAYRPPAIDENQWPTGYQHDVDRALTRVDRPDKKTVRYVYDETSGKLSQIVTPEGAIALSYAVQTGKLQTISTPDNVTLTYARDGSLLSGTTYSGDVIGTVSRDCAFRRSRSCVPGEVDHGFRSKPIIVA